MVIGWLEDSSNCAILDRDHILLLARYLDSRVSDMLILRRIKTLLYGVRVKWTAYWGSCFTLYLVNFYYRWQTA